MRPGFGMTTTGTAAARIRSSGRSRKTRHPAPGSYDLFGKITYFIIQISVRWKNPTQEGMLFLSRQ